MSSVSVPPPPPPASAAAAASTGAMDMEGAPVDSGSRSRAPSELDAGLSGVVGRASSASVASTGAGPRAAVVVSFLGDRASVMDTGKMAEALTLAGLRDDSADDPSAASAAAADSFGSPLPSEP